MSTYWSNQYQLELERKGFAYYTIDTDTSWMHLEQQVAKGIGKVFDSWSGGFVQLTSSLIITDVSEEVELPKEIELNQNYPNPFNPTTNISFSLNKSDKVSLKIFDINVREVKELVNKKLQPGTYSVLFNAINLSSGVYFYQLTTSQKILTKKMLLIK
jgi:hypothetical protein